jgi:hypothetical protein
MVLSARGTSANERLYQVIPVVLTAVQAVSALRGTQSGAGGCPTGNCRCEEIDGSHR